MPPIGDDRFVGAVSEPLSLKSLVGDSPLMRAMKELLARVAASRTATVLLIGESGVGKDLAARVIHGIGEQAAHPFRKIVCSGLSAQPGNADLVPETQGTVLLDDVGDLAPALQVDLLRMLEARRPVRVVAATTGDLKDKVSAGGFREDLYYRLQMMPIVIPPLRERRGDIPLLAGFYIDLFNRELRKKVRGASADALDVLERCRWPGNVRELRNAIERAVLLAADPSLQPEDFAGLSRTAALAPQFHLPPEGVNLEQLERQLLVEALERAGGNQTHAGQLLGINRDQVRYRIEKFGLDVCGHGKPERPGE